MNRSASTGLRAAFGSSAGTTCQRSRREPPTKPLSIRFTPAERQFLIQVAGKLSIGAYVRQTVLGDKASASVHIKPTRKRLSPGPDRIALGKALALLGQSDIARSLEEIARAATMGALPVTEEVVTEIYAACLFVREVRNVLITAINGPPSK